MVTANEKVKGMNALQDKKRRIEGAKRDEEDRASRALQSAGNDLRIGKNTISLQPVQTVGDLVEGMSTGQFSVSLRNYRDIALMEGVDADARVLSPMTIVVMPLASQLVFESVAARLSGDRSDYLMSKRAECCVPLLSNYAHIPGIHDGWRSVLGQELALTESNLAYASSWSVTSTRLAYAQNRAIPPLATDEVSKLYNVASSKTREAQPTVEAIGLRMVLFQELFAACSRVQQRRVLSQ
eukprot:3698689-Amphidinium_carterae.1